MVDGLVAAGSDGRVGDYLTLGVRGAGRRAHGHLGRGRDRARLGRLGGAHLVVLNGRGGRGAALALQLLYFDLLLHLLLLLLLLLTLHAQYLRLLLAQLLQAFALVLLLLLQLVLALLDQHSLPVDLLLVEKLLLL